jgi:hypothetical protein
MGCPPYGPGAQTCMRGLASVTAVSAGWFFSLGIHQVGFIQLPGTTRSR